MKETSIIYFGTRRKERSSFASWVLTNPWPNPLLTPSGTSVGDRSADLTLSGKSAGSGGIPPLWPFNPFFPLQLVPWPLPGGQLRKPPAGAGTGANKKDPKGAEGGPSSPISIKEDEIRIDVSDTEAQEFLDFDPTIVLEGTWDPPESMTAFL